MSMNDPIADLLTRIRNAYRAEHEDVQIPYSIMKEKIVKVMVDEGYVEGFEVAGEGTKKVLIVRIKYVDGTSVINGIKRVSKPSCRRYVGYNEILPVTNGMGISILSTPAGIMSDTSARKKHVGGEVVCNIW